MKKIFTLLGLAALGSTSVGAQLAPQNFNAGFPSTWSMIKGDNNTPSTQWVAAIQTKLAISAWMGWPRTSGGADSCLLTTSKFTTTAQADRWVISPSFTVNGTNAVLYWDDFATDPDAPDNMQIWVSPTAGTTAASFTQKIYDAPGAVEFTKRGISLGTFNGQTIRVAFRNNSTNKGILMMDNVGTEIIATTLDGAVTGVNFPTLASSSNAVKATVKNNGAQTITSVTLTYKVDGGAPVSQTFSSLAISAYGSQELTFTTPISGIATGSHTLQVDLTQTNGAADPVTSNNTGNKSFAVPGQSVQRAGLIEEFTSSTCPPCASFNVTFDPLILSNNANVPSSNFNVIKYQMNWPNPGNDVCYNPDGRTRCDFYGTNSIPEHWTNGGLGGNGNQAEIDASKTAPAYVTMGGSYVIKNDSLIATVTLTPNFTISGAPFKLMMAATERHYTNNGATTSQKEYYHVMRKMLPDGNGITVANWVAGQTQTFTQKYKYTVATPIQGNYNFWATPFSGALVAFVQDPTTGEIFQSRSIPAQWPASVSRVTSVGQVKLFPNPATTEAKLAFTVSEKSNVAIQVVDIAGRVVSAIADEEMSIGEHVMTINTATLANGMYNVVLRTEGGSVTERLNVVK